MSETTRLWMCVYILLCIAISNNILRINQHSEIIERINDLVEIDKRFIEIDQGLLNLIEEKHRDDE